MAERKTPIKALPVRELRPEIPHEHREHSHRPRPQDRRNTYFVEVSD